jgi:predicted dithiol-disulfide oxidoreductase (DUF899 family)
VGDSIFHAYSAYSRGIEPLVGTVSYLDMTPYGRQEDWEDSPEDWPQTPTGILSRLVSDQHDEH